MIINKLEPENRYFFSKNKNLSPNTYGLCPSKVEYVFPVVVDSMLPHVEFGPNDYRQDALHFNLSDVIIFPDLKTSFVDWIILV